MSSKEKVFILLSGGVDSTTALAFALEEHKGADFEAVTIDYGQRHIKEKEAAAAIAEHYDVPHVVIDAKGFMEGMLVDKGEANEAVPDVDYSDLPVGISPTYVTFRNGLMLSILAARAQAWVMAQQKALKEEWEHSTELAPAQSDPTTEFDAHLYIGVHADDGTNWAYPDCTNEFIGPMAAAIYVGTYQRVRLRTPFTFLSKAMVTSIGLGLAVPYEKTWSCYKGEDLHCGTCPTCRSRKQAFAQLGQKDPTRYAA